MFHFLNGKEREEALNDKRVWQVLEFSLEKMMKQKLSKLRMRTPKKYPKMSSEIFLMKKYHI
jgi:hypothetical protein